MLVDEAYNLQSHARIDQKLLRILSQCRPEILNIFQTYQYSMGLLNCSRMTKAYYWHIFLQADAKRDAYEKYLIKQNEEDSDGD